MNLIKPAILFILASLVAMAALGQKSVSGAVITAENNPIPFANITSSISQSSANVEGVFSIEIAEGDTHIIVSAIGFQEDSVLITGNKTIATLKENSVEIEDVVITALGIAREKKSIGYAITEPRLPLDPDGSSDALWKVCEELVGGMEGENTGEK